MALSLKLPPKILIVESDEALSTSVANTIERGLLNVSKANSEENAMKLAISSVPNIAIISSRMKDISAIEMANKLRKVHKLVNLPLIFLIDESEAVANYNMRDNEFVEIISRPFTPFQLMTGIKSLLRKSQPIFQDKLIKYKDVSIDLARYKVFKGQKPIHLGPTEFKILQLFMQSPRVIFSREQIINYVWGENKNIELRTVDVHVNRLRTLMNVPPEPKNHDATNISENSNKIRSMIKAAPHDVQFIKTVRSSGYCLNLPGEIE
jgi:two-component system phosphate regulon response regulator PhoB